MKLWVRARSVRESENTSQWQCDPKNTIPQWSRTPKRDPKKFRTELKKHQIENVLDRILAFDSTEESCSLDRVATAKCSPIP